ncbi:hypothetical protein BJX99DRAFT_252671 [Aspergillus californicus]
MKYSGIATLGMLGCALAAPQFGFPFPGFGGGEGGDTPSLPTPPSGGPSGAPTDLPTGFPTGFPGIPSGIPTDLPTPSGHPEPTGGPGGPEVSAFPIPTGFPSGGGEGGAAPTPTFQKRQFGGGFNLGDLFPSGFPDLGDLFPGSGSGSTESPAPTGGAGGGFGGFGGSPFSSGFPEPTGGVPDASGFPGAGPTPTASAFQA